MAKQPPLPGAHTATASKLVLSVCFTFASRTLFARLFTDHWSVFSSPVDHSSATLQLVNVEINYKLTLYSAQQQLIENSSKLSMNRLPILTVPLLLLLLSFVGTAVGQFFGRPGQEPTNGLYDVAFYGEKLTPSPCSDQFPSDAYPTAQ